MSDAPRLMVRGPGGTGLTADNATATNQNGTATNQNATATNQNGTATNQNATATNQIASLTADIDRIPAAPGVAFCAQFLPGAPILFNGPFVRFRPARNVRFVVGVAGVPTNFRVIGTDVYGGALDVIVAGTGAGTFETTHAFDTITEVSSNVDPGDTVDVQTGKGFSIGPITGLDDINTSVGVDGALQTVDFSDETTASIVPATAPDGAKVYTVRYTVDHNHTQDAHTHVQNAHTHVQDAHTHVQNAHTHVQNAHSHTVT